MHAGQDLGPAWFFLSYVTKPFTPGFHHQCRYQKTPRYKLGCRDAGEMLQIKGNQDQIINFSLDNFLPWLTT